MSQQALVDEVLLITGASRSHSDTPHSVGLLWTSYQPDPETFAWQHTTLTREWHAWTGGTRTHNLSKRAAADPRLKTSRWMGPATSIMLYYTFLQQVSIVRIKIY